MFYLARLGGGEGVAEREVWSGLHCFIQPGVLLELELLVLTLFNAASSSSPRITQHFYGLKEPIALNISQGNTCIICYDFHLFTNIYYMTHIIY